MMMSSLARRSLVAFAAALSLAAVACGKESSDAPVAADAPEVVTRRPADNGANQATSCHGTEPFWSIAIDAKTVKYEDAGGLKRTIENRGPIAAAGTSAEFAALYQGKTSEDPDRFLNVVITRAGAEGCSDGMSDDVFPFNVSVLSGNELLIGCCR
jgi:uncharacterized membrane protein